MTFNERRRNFKRLENVGYRLEIVGYLVRGSERVTRGELNPIASRGFMKLITVTARDDGGSEQLKCACRCAKKW
jgi:hypothetical protein